ncbi:MULTISPECIES: HIT family protein [Apibacter]|uniref:HIT family protein n=1 Tax=Apibacter TaxID=1778601 RepID=UPI00136B37B8|nr:MULTISPECIES: HIT domain-containing protein [Apibacter]MXO32113.1 HIT domain-containing protein [Apibacter sp. B2912]QII69767.1 HIT domain-containing protein [Apibacter sp. B3706]QII71799.1 HIT domain-containing protein [Apibacter sp. B2966]QYN49169.1 HIT domain-containing protein [Apibacter sp. ESL0432]QYN51081.1 HIT domain-containing protein [Apibacter sp. ESL0404]
MASIFSKIVAGEIPCYKVAESEKHLAFLDAFPVVIGHVLVIPKKETDKLFDLPKEEYDELMDFTYRVAQAVGKAIPCLRVGMSVQGLEVPHVHVHLIPLNAIGDMNFGNKLTLSSEEFTEIADKIKSYL